MIAVQFWGIELILEGSILPLKTLVYINHGTDLVVKDSSTVDLLCIAAKALEKLAQVRLLEEGVLYAKARQVFKVEKEDILHV